MRWLRLTRPQGPSRDYLRRDGGAHWPHEPPRSAGRSAAAGRREKTWGRKEGGSDSTLPTGRPKLRAPSPVTVFCSSPYWLEAAEPSYGCSRFIDNRVVTIKGQRHKAPPTAAEMEVAVWATSGLAVEQSGPAPRVNWPTFYACNETQF